MFTGIIEDVGTLVRVTPEGGGRRLGIRTAMPLGEVRIGDSIAVRGACLTVERHAGDVFEVVAGQETLAATTVGALREGSRVHLERALQLGARLDGHLVQGHVDGVGRVIRSEDARESWVLWVDVGAELAPYVATKGSICLDGVSLTVNEVDGSAARVNIIPHTARETCLGDLRPGDRVNVEVDLLARYVARLLAVRGVSSDDARDGGLTLDFLRTHGFDR